MEQEVSRRNNHTAILDEMTDNNTNGDASINTGKWRRNPNSIHSGNNTFDTEPLSRFKVAKVELGKIFSQLRGNVHELQDIYKGE